MVVYKKREERQDNDSDEYGDVYTYTTMKTDTRLFISHHMGDRTTEDAIDLFQDVERRRSIHSLIPVFTSDNWDFDHCIELEGVINN